MPRTRTAEPGRPGGRTQGRASVVAVSGRSHPLTRHEVVRAAATVLAAERRRAILSISFVGRARMAALNHRWKGIAAPTDVLAFALTGPDRTLSGDVYISPWVAARNAAELGVPLRRELARLVVHGVLHVLGYDHPDAGRTGSAMWRRQEKYLRELR